MYIILRILLKMGEPFAIRLGFVIRTAVKTDLDGLAVDRFQLDFLATPQHGHQLFNELLIFLHAYYKL